MCAYMCTVCLPGTDSIHTDFQVYQTHEFLMSHAEVNGFASEHLLVVLGICAHTVFKGRMTTDFSISLTSGFEVRDFMFG